MKKSLQINKQRVLAAFVAVISIVVTMTGCIDYPADEHWGAGYPKKWNRIISRYERPSAVVFQSAREVAVAHGAAVEVDEGQGKLDFEMNQGAVTITVADEGEGISRVEIRATTSEGRKDIELAAEIDKLIAFRLPR